MTKAIVIAGASSGVGKTTFTTGLIAALKARGRNVQPFKAGPDYLDPTYHSRAAGPEFGARNLDTWLLPPAHLVELYNRAACRADIAVIEGVMGLYDGKNGQSEEGSTGALAKLLNVPVLVVLDIGKLSRTAGALALGLQKFDPALNLAGFLLNNAGGQIHYEWTKQAVEEATGLPVLGWLPKNQDWALPERHLGLIPADEGEEAAHLEALLDRLARQVVETVDLAAIERIAVQASSDTDNTRPSLLFPDQKMEKRVRLGVARDKAFGFYYQDNLDLLEAWGAELVPFSPLNDPALPSDLSGLYLGGGFPEVFAAQLSSNRPMLAAIRQAARQNMPIYAECGGLMYLCQKLNDFDGKSYPMVGLLPYRTAMQSQRVKIGYAEAQARSQHPFLQEGEVIRAHEFHWSLLQDELDPQRAAYAIEAQGHRPEGWLEGNLLASYLHLHFGTARQLAPRFIEWCVTTKIQSRNFAENQTTKARIKNAEL